ncbi:TetR family transcriptional regulator [Streptomyces noursei]|uniref:TetR family transcriptional regulator n=1 Tax=Streptomyces noursei TaxID=1971 RepID=UPI0038078BDA
MAKVQDRVIRTRGRILRAAAEVFAARGFAATTVDAIIQLAAEDGEGMSTGRLYQQFPSKESLVVGIFEATVTTAGVPKQQTFALQEFVDTGLVLAYRLRTEPFLRAALRLSVDPNLGEAYGAVWPSWIQITISQLSAAAKKNELLPGVEPAEFARQVAGGWAGLGLVGHAYDKSHARFERDISTMYGNLLNSLAVPALLPKIDVAPERGGLLYEKYLQEQEAQAGADA